MKNLTSTLGRLALALTATLALGSCSRAGYATLPRSTPYLGSTPVAATRQAVPAQVAPTATPLATEAVAVLPAPAAPVAPLAPAAPAVAAAPVAKAAPVAAAPRKLNLVQRLAVKKVTKKLDQVLAKAPQLKKHDATASTTRSGLDDRLRTAILLAVAAIVIGIIASLLNSSFIGAIGVVVFIVALVFLFLYLIDIV